MISSNESKLVGTISSDFGVEYSDYNQTFVSAKLDVKRNSSQVDTLKIISPESKCIDIQKGDHVLVEGETRTHSDKATRTVELFVYAFTIAKDNSSDSNICEFDGYICKPPTLYTTSRNKKISNFLVAVNREYNKSSYIPCVAWNHFAEYSSKLQVGSHIKCRGRLQSRHYEKNGLTYNTTEIAIISVLLV